MEEIDIIRMALTDNVDNPNFEDNRKFALKMLGKLEARQKTAKAPLHYTFQELQAIRHNADFLSQRDVSLRGHELNTWLSTIIKLVDDCKTMQP